MLTYRNRNDWLAQFDNAVKQVLDPIMYAPTEYWDTDDNVTFTKYIDLPGVKKEDLKITIKNSNVEILAERKLKKSSFTYDKSYTLPKDLDKDSVKAKLEDGVLMLSFNVCEKCKPKEIQVVVK